MKAKLKYYFKKYQNLILYTILLILFITFFTFSISFLSPSLPPELTKINTGRVPLSHMDRRLDNDNEFMKDIVEQMKRYQERLDEYDHHPGEYSPDSIRYSEANINIDNIEEEENPDFIKNNTYMEDHEKSDPQNFCLIAYHYFHKVTSNDLWLYWKEQNMLSLGELIIKWKNDRLIISHPIEPGHYLTSKKWFDAVVQDCYKYGRKKVL